MNSALVQDLFGGVMRKAFPNASEVDLYGSSIVFHEDGSLTIRCAGEEKQIGKEKIQASAA